MTTATSRQRVVVPVTIASGQSQASPVNLGGLELVGIAMPAAWDTAAITLLGLAADGSTYSPVKNEAGTEFSVSVAAGSYTALSVAATGIVKGLGLVRVRSGNLTTPVAQSASRVVHLICLS